MKKMLFCHSQYSWMGVALFGSIRSSVVGAKCSNEGLKPRNGFSPYPIFEER
jgi:hypothetical protein